MYVWYRIVDEAAKQTVTKNGRTVKPGRKDLKSRALTELAPNGNLSCLLTTADPDMATKTHFLYETGGNIGKHSLHLLHIISYFIFQHNIVLYNFEFYLFKKIP